MSQIIDAPAGPREILSSHLPQIAMELAMDLLPASEIKRLYGLSDEQWEKLLGHPAFDRMLQDAILTWASAKNAENRIKFKAQASVEMSLLRFHTDINNPEIALSARTEALKTIMKLAGMDKPEAPQVGGTGGWSLTINLGSEQIRMTPSAPSTPTIEGQPA